MAEVKKTSNTSVKEKKVTEPNNKNQAKTKDIEENKVYGILAYLGILFLVPLLAAPKSPFAKFHANQGCVLFIGAVGLSIIAAIPILGWILAPLGMIAVLVLAVMGIINAANGKMEKLPLIGDIEIIK